MTTKLATNYATLTLVPLVMLFIIYVYIQLRRIPYTSDWIVYRIKSVFMNDTSTKKRMETSGSFDNCNNCEMTQKGQEIAITTSPKNHHLYYKVYAHEHPQQIQISNHFQQI